jgi:phosphoglucosamine mutase
VKRLFGTDGIRGVAGSFPLDPETVTRIGEALGRSLAAATGRPPALVLGRDTRESGPVIEEALLSGLRAAGARGDRGGVLTTPAVACLARLAGYDAGVVISASHNPYQDNGIKVFSGRGTKLPDALEASIERMVLDGPGAEHVADGHERHWGPAAGGDLAGCGPAGPDGLRERYVDCLLAAVAPGRFLEGQRIVLDCGNGAAYRLGPEALGRAGAEVIAIHAAPDGRNINAGCGALHPQGLAAEVVRRRAALGLAFDGDADRCVVVDHAGRVLDGDHVLYLAARDLKRAGRLRGDRVIGTVMSNLWVEKALAAEGIALGRAAVGDKYVLEEMERTGCVLGGEQSGHVIFLEKATTGDGLLTGLLLAELLARTRLDLAAWAATVRPCPQVLVNVRVRARPPLASHPAIGPAIRAEEERLAGRGRLLVRYSGTEPQARIMVEAESERLVEDCAGRLRAIIEQEIGQDA